MTSPIFEVKAGGKLTGEVRVPGDKSISHRAVMLGALAEGNTEISGFLEGEDCLHTLAAFRDMGVKVERIARGLRVHGAGLRGLRAPKMALDLGNSGTSMRLMAGLMAGQAFAVTLVGDESLTRRPMKRIVEPLRRMGALIEAEEWHAPLRIRPAKEGLKAISWDSPIASAQVKSAILLAGLYAAGTTRVTEPAASRDHTERMLRSFGVEVETTPGAASVAGGQALKATRVQVPADISSAAFFMVGAAIQPGSEVLLKDVGVNPTRTGIIEILREMGADIELLNARSFGDEPVADIRVHGRALRGIRIRPELVASAIDEFPALFVAAACAQGTTEISGAAELRVKESDRIESMCSGLAALGIEADAKEDGARIVGGAVSGGTLDSRGDHRVAMAFAMAGLRASGTVTIRDCANVETSFPGFAQLAARTGLRIKA